MPCFASVNICYGDLGAFQVLMAGDPLWPTLERGPLLPGCRARGLGHQPEPSLSAEPRFLTVPQCSLGNRGGRGTDLWARCSQQLPDMFCPRAMVSGSWMTQAGGMGGSKSPTFSPPTTKGTGRNGSKTQAVKIAGGDLLQMGKLRLPSISSIIYFRNID